MIILKLYDLWKDKNGMNHSTHSVACNPSQDEYGGLAEIVVFLQLTSLTDLNWTTIENLEAPGGRFVLVYGSSVVNNHVARMSQT